MRDLLDICRELSAAADELALANKSAHKSKNVSIDRRVWSAVLDIWDAAHRVDASYGDDLRTAAEVDLRDAISRVRAVGRERGVA